ncbi:cytochrome P450 [Dipodascopsis uninucleata]
MSIYMDILVGSIVFLCSITAIYQLQISSGSIEPPMIKGSIPYLGVAIDMVKRPTEMLLRLKEKYGYAYTVLVAGRRMTILSDHVSGIKQLFRNEEAFDNKYFIRHVSLNVFKYPTELLDNQSIVKDINSVLVPWLSQSKNANAVGERISDIYMIRIDQKSGFCPEVGSSVQVDDLFLWARENLFIASALGIFGDKFPVDKFYEPYKEFEATLSGFVQGYPRFMMRKAYESRDKLFEALEEFYADKEIYTSNCAGFINAIIDTFENYPDLCNAKCMSRYFFSLIFASKSNSIPVAYWMLANIVNNPELRDEILEIIKTNYNPETDEFNWNELYREKLLNSCFKESARLNSNVTVSRTAIRNTNMRITNPDGNGYKDMLIRKGDHIMLYTNTVQWDASVYPEPLTWYGKRFMPESIGTMNNNTKNYSSYVPWGGGSHLCPGRHLALNEAITQLVNVLWHFDIEPLAPIPKPYVAEKWGMGAAQPATKFPVQFIRRDRRAEMRATSA